jgi:hypothetical protein
MSLPHTCTCRICGTEFPMLADPLDAAALGAFNREYGVKTLANAIIKIAPEQAKQIAEQWEQLQGAERQALDDLLSVLRSLFKPGAVK